MTDIKALRESRAKIVADAREILNGEVTAEAEARFDSMMAEADKIKARIDREERALDAEREIAAKVEQRADANGLSFDEQANREEVATRAFDKWMRGGMEALDADERRAMGERRAQSVGTPSAGGFTVPEGFYNVLTEAMKAYGGVREVATVLTTASGQALPMPTADDTAQKGELLAENTAAAEQDVTFGSKQLDAYKYSSKLVRVSIELMQDSAFDMNAFLGGALGTRIARITNEHFTSGTGTGQPNGIVTASALGVTVAGGAAAAIDYDDLVDLEHSVDPAYRNGARFMMNDGMLKTIKKLKDTTGRPLWSPGIAVREPDTILGYGYTVNQDMADVALAAKPIIFGDLRSYFVRDVLGVQVVRLNERYADLLQVGFLAYSRHDGELLGTGTVKHIVIAA